MHIGLARFLSYIGHPLLMLTYTLLLMLFANPYTFGVHHPGDPKSMVLILSVFFCTFLIPGVGVALMKMLGLIKSFEMEDQQERIGPYIVTGVFYLWLFKNLIAGGAVPPLYAQFALGATIGLFFAFFINIFTKISAHATGAGGFAVMMLITAFEWSGSGLIIPVPGGSIQLSFLMIAALTLLFAGLIGTARLALQAHTTTDIWRGYAAGAGAVLLAYFIG